MDKFSFSENDRIKNGDRKSHLECPVCHTSDVFGEEKILNPNEVLEILSCWNDHFWEEIWTKTKITLKKPEDYGFIIKPKKSRNKKLSCAG